MKEPWWKTKWGNDKICAISYCRLRPGKNIIRLSCKHSFYRSALFEWIQMDPNKEARCPVCRTSIVIESKDFL
jgi:hypothetical protein